MRVPLTVCGLSNQSLMAIGEAKTRLRRKRHLTAYSHHRICAFVTGHALVRSAFGKFLPLVPAVSGTVRWDITTARLGWAHVVTSTSTQLLCARCPPGRAALAQQGIGQRRRTPRPHHRGRGVLRQRRSGRAFVSRHDPAHAGDVRRTGASVCVFHLRHALGDQRGVRWCARARGADPRARTAGRDRHHAGRAQRRPAQDLDHRSRSPGPGVRGERDGQRAGPDRRRRTPVDRGRRPAAALRSAGDAAHRHPQGGGCAVALGGPDNPYLSRPLPRATGARAVLPGD